MVNLKIYQFLILLTVPCDNPVYQDLICYYEFAD